MGPSYTQAPNGTVAGYGNPYYSASAAPASQQGSIMDAVGYNIPLSNQETVTNPNSGGSVQGASTASAPDPYAAYGGKAAYDSKVGAFNTQNTGVINTASGSADAAARNYGSSILDYLGSARQTQNGINNEGVQSELSRQQGARGVLDYVNHGIQSGGVMLGNRNAGTSSATEALARAYSTLGQHQMAGVGTQYAQDQNKIGTEQNNLGIQNATQGRHNEEYKANAVAGIVQSAQQAISNIKSNMQYANLPDQINMQQEIDQITNDATGKLNALDHTFSEGIAGINPSDLNTRAGQAQQLTLQGTAASNPYQLTTQAPANWQGGNPAGADLPIFTLPRNKQLA